MANKGPGCTKLQRAPILEQCDDIMSLLNLFLWLSSFPLIHVSFAFISKYPLSIMQITQLTLQQSLSVYDIDLSINRIKAPLFTIPV